MTLAIVTVCDSISKLSVAGLVIKDLDQIPDGATRQTPMLAPMPNGFVSAYDQVRRSQGSGSTLLAKYDVTYVLTYRLLYAEVGSGYGLGQIVPKMVSETALVIDAILTNDALTGCVDIRLQTIPTFGTVDDAAGRLFYGCDLSFLVTEYPQG